MFFPFMFVCSISIYFHRNSWTRHILNFEVRPNWSTSWHLSRRKASQCEWSMLIPLYMFYLGRVKSGNRNLPRNIENLFIISSWTVLKVIYKHLQFEIVVIVLVCSGQLFSTSVITTADSARMSIQDATETSWPNNFWHVLWRIPCTVNFCLTLSYLLHPFNFQDFLGHFTMVYSATNNADLPKWFGSQGAESGTIAHALQPSPTHGSVENGLKWSRIIWLSIYVVNLGTHFPLNHDHGRLHIIGGWLN